MNTPTSPTPNTDRRNSRRRAAVGVGTGLLAGAAIGLTMAAPTFTSAASDDAADAAAFVAQDTDTDTDAETVRPEPGERVRDLLQELVDDGTITTEQADAVAEHLAENRPERPEGRRGPRGHHPGLDGEVVAELLGIDAETLRDELRSGSSIAELAEANGVDPQVVVDALVEAAGEHLELSVENGRLTEAEAAERLESVEERIEARVNGERPERPGRPVESDDA